MRESLSLFQRFFTAIVGVLLGGFGGMLSLYGLMLLVGSAFGFDTARLDIVVRATLGFFLGLWFPHRRSWLDFLWP
jgi:hypothetical protein